MRLLIVRTGAMGDILHALPAVTALRAALPDVHVGWAVEPHWHPLLSPQLVDKIHLVPTRAWKRRPISRATFSEVLSLRRELRAERYDVTVDLQGSIRSAIIGRLAGASRFLGPDSPRESQARHLYRETIATSAPDVISRAAQLLSAAIRKPLSCVPPILPADSAAETWCNQLGLPSRFVFLVPGAGWAAKQWPLQHFASLTESLTAADYPVLFNATTAEHDALTTAGARPISSTIPQLTALTRRAALVIGGDTGPLHLAAALGRPVVALFGPTDPARNGPHFPGAAPLILRAPGSVTSYTRTSHSEAGFAGITVEEVLIAAKTPLSHL